VGLEVPVLSAWWAKTVPSASGWLAQLTSLNPASGFRLRRWESLVRKVDCYDRGIKFGQYNNMQDQNQETVEMARSCKRTGPVSRRVPWHAGLASLT